MNDEHSEEVNRMAEGPAAAVAAPAKYRYFTDEYSNTYDSFKLNYFVAVYCRSVENWHIRQIRYNRTNLVYMFVTV